MRTYLFALKEVHAMLQSAGARGKPRSSSAGQLAQRPGPIALVRPAQRTARLLVLTVILPCVGLVALAVGSVHLPLATIWLTILHPSLAGTAHTIVWELRIPRVLLAAGVGAGLGVAGAMLQTMFRNPLVDPYITGVSAGAALVAVLGFTLGVTFALIPAIAFLGGLACAAIVAWIGASDGPVGNLRLVLAGVAISALASAFVTLVLLQREQSGGLTILGWLAGGISGRGWSDLALMSAYLGVGFVAALSQVHALNLLRLGSSAAQGFGLAVLAARWRIVASAALITAACVSVSGIVGFVGLMVPHVLRRFVGGDARWLLPGSALGGAVVVVIADLLARTIMAPAEIPLGVLLAFVGVPFFLIIARRPVQL
jgi:iron complex transport system permease protein